MTKCVYCGQKMEVVSEYEAHVHTRNFAVCSKNCQEETERYVKNDAKLKKILYFILFFVSLGIIANTFVKGNEVMYYLCLLTAGLVLFILPYPFTAFESFKHASIKMSTIVCRIFAALSFLLAALLLFQQF